RRGQRGGSRQRGRRGPSGRRWLGGRALDEGGQRRQRLREGRGTLLRRRRLWSRRRGGDGRRGVRRRGGRRRARHVERRAALAHVVVDHLVDQLAGERAELQEADAHARRRVWRRVELPRPDYLARPLDELEAVAQPELEAPDPADRRRGLVANA